VSRKLWFIFALLVPGLVFTSAAAGGDEGGGLSLTVHLIPEAQWNHGTPDPKAVLESGEVFLFREGTYEPELVLKANAAGQVPPGTWVWVAQAPGYTSINTGVLNVPATGSSSTKTLLWPVVPACEMVLDEDPGWRAIGRLDTVSIDRAAVFPISPRRGRLWIPAGSFLQYTTDNRGLAALGDVQRCKAEERRTVGPPSRPAADRQDFLVRAKLPLDSEAKAGDLILGLQGRGGGSQQGRIVPSVTVWQGRIGSFFFLDVPVTGPLQVVGSHPELRSIARDLDSLGGSATEVPLLEFQERFDLELVVDYQPARSHDIAYLYPEYCGRHRNLMTLRQAEACRPLALQRDLQEGLHSYRFEDLDEGLYIFNARVDEEKIPGLGSDVSLYLDEEASPPEPVTLREMEIHGNLLRDGEAVAGEVRLQLSLMDGESLPLRRFPTDEDLTYHLYYFGALPHAQALYLLPEVVQSRAPEELRGLYWSYSLEGCDEEGLCRSFKLFSILVGEGRMDLPLGGRGGVTFEVVDQGSGKGVPGALILFGRGSPELQFYDGEVHWHKPIGEEAIGALTDAGGRKRVANLEPGSQYISISKAGYRAFGKEVPVPEGEQVTLRVELEREAESGALRFAFADGQPVSAAVLRGYRWGGNGEAVCFGKTTGAGILSVPEGCLADDSTFFVLLHRDARISAYSAAALRQVSEVEVARGAIHPVRIRLETEDGRPVPYFPVRLRYPTFTLGPNDLLAAASVGQSLFYLSDARGELVLRGVDPEAPVLPTVEVEHGGLRGRLSLVGAEGGVPLVLMLR